MPSGRSSGPSGCSCAWIASVLARDRAYPRAIPASRGSGASAGSRCAAPRAAAAPPAPPSRRPAPRRSARRRPPPRRAAQRPAPTRPSSASRSARAAASGSVGVGDRAHDDDPGRAALDDLVHVARVEPADREPRLRHRARRMLDVRQARRGAARLGRRRVHRADREVVDVRVLLAPPWPGRARGWSGRRCGPARPRRGRPAAGRRPGRRGCRRRRTSPPGPGGR